MVKSKLTVNDVQKFGDKIFGLVLDNDENGNKINDFNIGDFEYGTEELKNFFTVSNKMNDDNFNEEESIKLMINCIKGYESQLSYILDKNTKDIIESRIEEIKSFVYNFSDINELNKKEKDLKEKQDDLLKGFDVTLTEEVEESVDENINGVNFVSLEERVSEGVATLSEETKENINGGVKNIEEKGEENNSGFASQQGEGNVVEPEPIDVEHEDEKNNSEPVDTGHENGGNVPQSIGEEYKGKEANVEPVGGVEKEGNVPQSIGEEYKGKEANVEPVGGVEKEEEQVNGNVEEQTGSNVEKKAVNGDVKKEQLGQKLEEEKQTEQNNEIVARKDNIIAKILTGLIAERLKDEDYKTKKELEKQLQNEELDEEKRKEIENKINEIKTSWQLSIENQDIEAENGGPFKIGDEFPNNLEVTNDCKIFNNQSGNVDTIFVGDTQNSLNISHDSDKKANDSSVKVSIDELCEQMKEQTPFTFNFNTRTDDFMMSVSRILLNGLNDYKEKGMNTICIDGIKMSVEDFGSYKTAEDVCDFIQSQKKSESNIEKENVSEKDERDKEQPKMSDDVMSIEDEEFADGNLDNSIKDLSDDFPVETFAGQESNNSEDVNLMAKAARTVLKRGSAVTEGDKSDVPDGFKVGAENVNKKVNESGSNETQGKNNEKRDGSDLGKLTAEEIEKRAEEVRKFRDSNSR